MKRKLFLLCAFFASMGAWAQDTNLCAENGVTAKIGDMDVLNVLNGTGVQPNTYDENSEMNIVVDLGSSKAIDGFSITFSGDRWVSKFTLSYSTDGSSYTKIADYATGRTAQNPETTIARDFASQVTAQYIKYTSKKSNKNETDDNWSETIKSFQLIQYATGAMVPPTHNDIYEEIFTKGYSSTIWQTAWNGGATDAGTATYGGTPVKSLTSVGAIHFGKTSDTQDFSANIALYDKLNVDIYVAHATTDYQFNFNNGGYTQNLTLDAGWNTVTVNVSDVTAANLKILSIRCKNDNKTDLKLANIYFSQAVEDVGNYVIASLTASPAIVKKNTATAITFTPKNANGTDLTTYGSSKVTVAYTITSGTGTLSDGTLTITGDDPVVITATATRVSDSHESTATATINLYPAAPTDPTENSENVVAVYSETYSATSPSYAASGWGTPACTFSSKEEIDLGTSNNALHVTGDGIGFGISFTAEGTKLSDYAELYFDIYPANAVTSGKVFVEQDAQSFANFTATAGSWQTKHFIFTASSDKATYLFISLGAGATNDFFLDNIYFVKKDNSKVYIGEESDGVVTVTGNVTTANKSEVEAITAKVIDLRGATIDGAVTSITLKDNQLIIAKAESATNESKESAMADALTGNTSNIIITDGTYYWAMKPIVYTDQNERQPVSFSINTLTQGYTITRSIPSNKYVTAAPMAVVTAPEGIDVYEFTNYSDGTISFIKKANREMAVKTPYVLYNTTGSPIDLVVSGTGDLNPTVDAITVTQNSANFVANLNDLTTDGSQYVLSNGDVYKGNGMKVGAYRAYFTGVSAPSGSVKAIFGDIETSIDTIEGLEVRTGDVYDLSGRRVSNPKKGLYIINGKKVLMK